MRNKHGTLVARKNAAAYAICSLYKRLKSHSQDKLQKNCIFYYGHFLKPQKAFGEAIFLRSMVKSLRNFAIVQFVISIFINIIGFYTHLAEDCVNFGKLYFAIVKAEILAISSSRPLFF